MARRLAQLLAPPAAAAAASATAPSLPLPSPATLAWVLWAWARVGYSPPRALLLRCDKALRGPQLLVQLYALDPADASRLCWALAELRYFSGAVPWAGLLGCKGSWSVCVPVCAFA